MLHDQNSAGFISVLNANPLNSDVIPITTKNVLGGPYPYHLLRSLFPPKK